MKPAADEAETFDVNFMHPHIYGVPLPLALQYHYIGLLHGIMEVEFVDGIGIGICGDNMF